MPSDVLTGHKTEFWLHDGTALVELGEIVDVPEMPSGERELIETSHMKTINYKTYLSAPLKEGSEVTIVMNYIPNSATDTICQAAENAATERAYKIVYYTITGTKRKKTGNLIVRKYVPKNPMDDRRTADLTIKWTSDAVDAVEA
jgi:hypothetical protein